MVSLLLLLAANDTAGAIERFREAILLAPENARADYHWRFSGRGNEREARAHFAEAQRLAPYLRPSTPRVKR